MNEHVILQTRSVIPAVALFTVLFGAGLYAGNLFAATTSGNVSSRATVYAFSSNGADGADGQDGAPGRDGISGQNGESSASVKIVTTVNGQVVQNIDEHRASDDGSPVVIDISTTTSYDSGNGHAGDSGDAPPAAREGESVDVSASADAIASDETAAATSETATSSDEVSGFVGFYSFIRSIFSHVASFFHLA
ncbi:MAG TPA: hypothetical protein VHF05_03405 [Candidatus Paceibacterota bacterium]|jgi:hypothetical protein|nr:hypothetical protein [Candidatus Paceibacterota bacterium]